MARSGRGATPPRTDAAAQLERIVSLVAELSRGHPGQEEGRRLADLAGTCGVSPQQIAGDIRTLTTLCDHAEAEWLLSLSAWQQDDRVSVRSLGPFRRPVLLSPAGGLIEPQSLADWILEDGLNVRFQLQLHKLLWGNMKGK